MIVGILRIAVSVISNEKLRGHIIFIFVFFHPCDLFSFPLPEYSGVLCGRPFLLIPPVHLIFSDFFWTGRLVLYGYSGHMVSPDMSVRRGLTGWLVVLAAARTRACARWSALGRRGLAAGFGAAASVFAIIGCGFGSIVVFIICLRFVWGLYILIALYYLICLAVPVLGQTGCRKDDYKVITRIPPADIRNFSFLLPSSLKFFILISPTVSCLTEKDCRRRITFAAILCRPWQPVWCLVEVARVELAS